MPEPSATDQKLVRLKEVRERLKADLAARPDNPITQKTKSDQLKEVEAEISKLTRGVK